MRRTEAPIIVEETFQKPVETVWSAITEAPLMRKWFFDTIPEFKPVVGFSVEFDVDAGERVFQHVWKVTKVIPQRLIEYNWKYGGYTGDSNVAFELRDENGATTLRLTHTVTEDFQEDIPEFTRESGLTGWRYFINQSLKKYLA